MTKFAIVTGSCQGIGEACVNVLTDRGYKVIGVDIQEEQSGSRAVDFYQVDLTKMEELEAFCTQFAQKYPHLDLLVNNAGVGGLYSIEETTVETWDRIMALNTRAPFFLVKLLLLLLKKAPANASVVNVGSVHATATYPKVHPYATSKGGIQSLTRSLALELAPKGIRVNAIAPGATLTPAQGQQRTGEELVQIGQQIAIGRLANSAEIAKAVAFLASEDASYVAGEMLVVDGGLLCKQSIL